MYLETVVQLLNRRVLTIWINFICKFINSWIYFIMYIYENVRMCQLLCKVCSCIVYVYLFVLWSSDWLIYSPPLYLYHFLLHLLLLCLTCIIIFTSNIFSKLIEKCIHIIWMMLSVYHNLHRRFAARRGSWCTVSISSGRSDWCCWRCQQWHRASERWCTGRQWGNNGYGRCGCRQWYYCLL